MSVAQFFKDVMSINSMPDDEKKAEASKQLFKKLNATPMPEYFNWAEEVFEGIHVKERPEQPALIWADLDTGKEKTFSYREMMEKSNQLLNFLRKHDISKGDVLYIMIPALPEIWFASLATIKGGIVLVPTAMTMTAKELEYRFDTYPPAAVIATSDSAKLIDEALGNLGITPKVKICTDGMDGWIQYAETEKESTEAAAEKTKSDDIILCFFTSGTTGMPKRVVHTATSYPVGHLSTANIIGIRPGDVHNNLSQPGWAKYAWSCFFAPLNVGATVTGFNYSGRLNVEKYLEAVDKYKVNVFCAPPTAWRAFIISDLSKFKFEALRESVSAGEPLNPEIIQTWKKHTGNVIRDFYGQTESTAMIGNPPWYKDKVIPGSFGEPHFMYDIVLVDDEGNEITKPDEVGHITVRLSNWRAIGLFREYLGSPDKMAEAFRGNYYYTGDRAYFDDKGYWWFVGRADDVIKSSDYRIGPFEVESALVEHEAVAEAAVVGSPDPKRWQLVKAFVILKPGYEPSRELALDLFRHSMKVLAKFKIPRIIEFVPEVPKTISGKIRRIELRELEIKAKEKGQRGEHEYFYHEFPELKSSSS
ncbi:MAG: AMP-binding protein [Deltaproteobacteria bacterium]|nr:AMP-binding protein [Deltaproteobacteria bacterium]MBW2067734.1 AMP-binding protein [Deltaproteobacteria bacterium]